MPNIVAFEPIHPLAHSLMPCLKELNPDGHTVHAATQYEVTRLLINTGWPVDLIILGHREDEHRNKASSGTETYRAVRATFYKLNPIIGVSLNPEKTFALALNDDNFHPLPYLPVPQTGLPYWNLPALRELFALLAP